MVNASRTATHTHAFAMPVGQEQIVHPRLTIVPAIRATRAYV